ncbi:MAG: hypothetical protein AAGB00_00105 [Planctomycetota bacterium]
MGLDGVEMVMAIEDRFGIAIADEEAAAILTVGQLNDLVRSRLEAREARACHSLPAFLSVRAATREVVADPSLRLRPATRIEAVVPGNRRRALWTRFHGLLRGRPPGLRRPELVRRLLWAACSALLLVSGMAASIDAAIFPLGVLGTAAAAVVLNLATSPWRVCPPEGFETLGDVTRRIVRLRVATNTDVQTADVEAATRQVIVEQLGVLPEEVVPEASFVKDLGMD